LETAVSIEQEGLIPYALKGEITHASLLYNSLSQIFLKAVN